MFAHPVIRLLYILALSISLYLPGSGAAAQALPREINTSDLIQGYVPAGIFVVTTGHLAYIDDKVRLNPSMSSAMVPAIVDVTQLPSTSQEKLRVQCRAVQITSGGCAVKVQGQVQQIDARPGLVATDIEFLPPLFR